MPKKLSQMTIKDWVEAVGLFIVICGIICFVIGIGTNVFSNQAQTKNFDVLKSYWKTGLQLEIIGIVIMVLAGMFPSKGGSDGKA
jgi:di/tricarboxylate transporter